MNKKQLELDLAIAKGYASFYKRMYRSAMDGWKRTLNLWLATTISISVMALILITIQYFTLN